MILHLQIGSDDVACELDGTNLHDKGDVISMTWNKERVTCEQCLGTKRA